MVGSGVFSLRRFLLADELFFQIGVSGWFFGDLDGLRLEVFLVFSDICPNAFGLSSLAQVSGAGFS